MKVWIQLPVYIWLLLLAAVVWAAVSGHLQVVVR